MRLAAALFFKKGPNGNIFTGKNRLVKAVDAKSLADLRLDYEIEEQNMLWLRYPYLTVEQSYCHMKALGKPNNIVDQWRDAKIAKFSKVVTLEDRLMHLKVKDAWD